MTESLRWSGALGAAVLLALAGPVQAQQMPTTAEGNITLPSNAIILGNLGPRGLPAGYTLPNVNLGAPGLVHAPVGANPYALSTVPSFNPYLNTLASMGNSPLGTSGYGMSGYGGYGSSYIYPEGFSYGYALQGLASVTTAQGQYWNDIQKA